MLKEKFLKFFGMVWCCLCQTLYYKTSVNLFIVENGLTVWSATLRVFGAGKSDLTVGTPYARQPKY